MFLPKTGMLEWVQKESTHCCGIEDVYRFNYFDDGEEFECTEGAYSSETGLLCASFVNTKNCKIAYDYLKSKLILLYQSPVRKNWNTGNKVFMCVYLHPDRKKK